MSKRIDSLINKLHINSEISLKSKIPLLLRKCIPQNAIICDAQLNEHNQFSWAIIYQDGTDTFVHIFQDNKIYLEGEHEEEIVAAIKALINKLQIQAFPRFGLNNNDLSLVIEE